MIVLTLLAVFICVILVRTAMFRPKPQPEIIREELGFDRDAAVDALVKEGVPYGEERTSGSAAVPAGGGRKKKPKRKKKSKKA